ncbi:MAG: Gfo/Idh/MocA family oxidoreductase [Clostridiales bacterium]|nr:Gfo/Idh/MocA family oxidoreductase [Clostridiales bacterium]
MAEMRIGVIGFGGMGHYHVDTVKVPGVRFVAASDIDPAQLEDAGSLNLRAYCKDEEGFFSDPEINTVLVSVPNHLHKKYALMAAKAGKNVICEKPAALSPEDLAEMVDCANANNVLFEVHQNRRLDKDFKIAKKVYDEGLIGDIFNIESNIHMPNGRMHNWHQFKNCGGGMLYDWGIHCIDQALQLVPGKLDSVYCDLKSVFHTDVDDCYKIIMKFEKGDTVSLNLSTYVLKPYPRWMLCGSKGTCVIQGFDGSGSIYRTTGLVEKLPPRIEPNPAGPTRSFRPMPPGLLYQEPLPEARADHLDFYRNYLRAMSGKAELMVKNEEALRALRVIMACFESADAKRSVRFADRP